MKAIKVDILPKLAYCSKNLYLEEDYILLSPDVPLLKDFKKRLEDWMFESILSDGDPVFTEINSKKDTKAILTKKNTTKTVQEKEASEFFRDVCGFVENLFLDFLKGKSLSNALIANQIKNITKMLKTHKLFLLNFAALDSTGIDYSYEQSVKTAILSLSMGEILGMPIHKLINLGTAAILHRIGTMNIPHDLFYSDQELNSEQKKSISLFPLLGFRNLKAANFPISISLAILEHRENLDGSGYPRGITGDKMSFYGKIISIASAYSAIVSKRPYREEMDPHYGMMTLIKEKGIKYDEKVIRILLLTLTLYPVGTYVFMTDGSIGLVTETNSLKPKYPTLKLMFDHKMVYYADEPKIVTRADSEIFIDRALTKKETDQIKELLPY